MSVTLGNGTITFGNGGTFTPAGSAGSSFCRAWVSFVGSGAAASNQTIEGSGNVSSIYKQAGTAGTYTMNFVTAMQDQYYAAATSCCSGPSGYYVMGLCESDYASGNPIGRTSSYFVAQTDACNGGSIYFPTAWMAVFR